MLRRESPLRYIRTADGTWRRDAMVCRESPLRYTIPSRILRVLGDNPSWQFKKRRVAWGGSPTGLRPLHIDIHLLELPIGKGDHPNLTVNW